MGTTDRKKKALEAKERKKRSNKASQLRAKMKKGKELSPDELTILSDWDGQKATPKTPPKGMPETSKEVDTSSSKASPSPAPTQSRPPGVSSEKSPNPSSQPSPSVSQSETQASEPKLVGKPPPGPIPKMSKPGTKGWQKEYEFMAGDNRETACKEGAELWAKGLHRLNKDIEELEGKPLINGGLIELIMRDAMVLTLDKLLPDDLSVDPILISTIGTSVIAGQRVYQGRTAKAKEKKDAATTARDESFIKPRGPVVDDVKPEPKLKSVPPAPEKQIIVPKNEAPPPKVQTGVVRVPKVPGPKHSGPPVEDHDFEKVGPDGKPQPV